MAYEGSLKQRLFDAFRRAVEWGERVPRGLRTLLGIPLMVGGVFGFLPDPGLLDTAAVRRPHSARRAALAPSPPQLDRAEIRLGGPCRS